jgi:hypothetical protein
MLESSPIAKSAVAPSEKINYSSFSLSAAVNAVGSGIRGIAADAGVRRSRTVELSAPARVPGKLCSVKDI